VTAPDLPTPDQSYRISLIAHLGGAVQRFDSDLNRREPSIFSLESPATVLEYRSLSRPDNLEFLLSRSSGAAVAKVEIPLLSFPPDRMVSEWFEMRPITALPRMPIVFMDIHHNGAREVVSWDAPYGIIADRRDRVQLAIEKEEEEEEEAERLPLSESAAIEMAGEEGRETGEKFPGLEKARRDPAPVTVEEEEEEPERLPLSESAAPDGAGEDGRETGRMGTGDGADTVPDEHEIEPPPGFTWSFFPSPAEARVRYRSPTRRVNRVLV
jgi:hypothetical protein